jgi:ribulose 1,5-bisphosphate synthetase/thiazole synthase
MEPSDASTLADGDADCSREVKPETDTDVIVVGAGPTGLMLAIELRLAGVEALVFEPHSELRDTPKAGGLSGKILEL